MEYYTKLFYNYKDMTRAEIKKYIKKKYKVDIDVMNAKLDPELITSIKNTKGFAPAYHMNKTHWVNIEIGKVSDTKKQGLRPLFLFDRSGNRTRDSAVRGRRLNRLTNRPKYSLYNIAYVGHILQAKNGARETRPCGWEHILHIRTVELCEPHEPILLTI